MTGDRQFHEGDWPLPSGGIVTGMMRWLTSSFLEGYCQPRTNPEGPNVNHPRVASRMNPEFAALTLHQKPCPDAHESCNVGKFHISSRPFSQAHILSCFLVGYESRKAGPSLAPPCARSLEQWTVERMKFLKESQAKTQEKLGRFGKLSQGLGH